MTDKQSWHAEAMRLVEAAIYAAYGWGFEGGKVGQSVDTCIAMNKAAAARAALSAHLASMAAPGEPVALWQYRWTNPSNEPHHPPEMLAWKEVEHPHWQPLEMKLLELRSYRVDGKPCYEVRPLFAGAAPGADAKDAARYRWLRSSGGALDQRKYLDSYDEIVPEKLDAAIDSAMAKDQS